MQYNSEFEKQNITIKMQWKFSNFTFCKNKTKFEFNDS